MQSDHFTPSAEKAKKMLALALTEQLDAPRDNDTITLPEYTIQETLGQGGMGTVYRAIHTELNRVVALKIFSPKAEDKELFIERLKREGMLMAQLKHPNVLSIYDAAVMEDGTPYLVLEYIKGEDLYQKLKDEFKLNPRVAVRIAIKVCEALSAVHEIGIIHRDIKPANVLLGDNGSVKVMDFGISKNIRKGNQNTSLTMTGTTVGTADYMSPEQTRNEDLSPRSDLYSVGVLLYEMLMGVTPRGKFQPISKANIPKKLEYIIMRCLQQDQNKRPASAETLAHSLRKAYHLINNRKHKNYKSIILCGVLATGAICLVGYVSSIKAPTDPARVSSSWKLDGEIDKWSNLTENKSYFVAGKWWANQGSLYTQKNQSSQYFFTFSAGYNYHFSTEFSRIHSKGNMCIFLPTVKGLVVFELDYKNKHLTGFHSVNNKDLSEQEISSAIAIETGKIYNIEIVVTTSKLVATINGKEVSTIDLYGKIFKCPSHWSKQKKLPFKLGLGSNSHSVFKNTQVRRLQ